MHTLDIGDTSSDSTLMRGLYTFCLAKPGSMTYTMPSMVREVSAMLVDTTILRPAGPPTRAGGGAGSKISCCCFGGRVEYSGYTFTGPTCMTGCAWSPHNKHCWQSGRWHPTLQALQVASHIKCLLPKSQSLWSCTLYT